MLFKYLYEGISNRYRIVFIKNEVVNTYNSKLDIPRYMDYAVVVSFIVQEDEIRIEIDKDSDINLKEIEIPSFMLKRVNA